MPPRNVAPTLALAFSLAGFPAIQASITPVTYPSPIDTMGTISGDIVNIDSVNNMIQVREASQMVQTIHINDHVEILKRGEAVKLNDLSLGDFVTVNAR